MNTFGELSMPALPSCDHTICLALISVTSPVAGENGVVEKNVQDSRRRIWIDLQSRK